MDRFDAIRVLLAMVDAGSLSGGSRKLNAPLPSVSRKVADLERHLGTNLVIRTSRNLQLTDAGRDFVTAARTILAELEEAERRASGEYQTPRGTLTVTMPMEFGNRRHSRHSLGQSHSLIPAGRSYGVNRLPKDIGKPEFSNFSSL